MPKFGHLVNCHRKRGAPGACSRHQEGRRQQLCAPDRARHRAVRRKPLPVVLICYTLDLASTEVPEAFTPELLTFPIDYRPKHIKALGFIRRDHGLHEDAALLAARNRHVEGLRRLPDCAGFGEVLE
jgi:hypothetical protein